jgi:hypothetical protein
MKNLKKWSLGDWAIAIISVIWLIGLVFITFKYGN